MGPRSSGRFLLALAVGVVLPAAADDAGAVEWLKPREIHVDRMNVAPELVEATQGSQIERGKRRPVLDGVGWVVGIPAKIVLWDRRVDNHNVSAETEDAIRRYLDDNDLDHVKVAINLRATAFCIPRTARTWAARWVALPTRSRYRSMQAP